MKRDPFVRIFLVVIAGFLGLIALRPLIPDKVEAQAHPKYDFYIEPGTTTVRAPDGATLLAGAQVRATARAPSAPAPVGTLLATGGAGAVVPLRAVGATDVQVTTDAAGVAAFPALPVGDLMLTIVPPANPNGAGAVSDIAITSVPISVAAAGLTQTATLVNRVSLSGVLSDAAGALVTAIDTSITAPGRVVTATVDADGGYTLRVDPGRTYQLIVDPASNASVVRAMLGSVTAGTADTAIGTRVLPIGHPLTGSVTASAGGAISGALIQVFCPAWSSQCLDPSFALADTISDRTGRFQLRLAEPARN